MEVHASLNHVQVEEKRKKLRKAGKGDKVEEDDPEKVCGASTEAKLLKNIFYLALQNSQNAMLCCIPAYVGEKSAYVWIRFILKYREFFSFSFLSSLWPPFSTIL